MIVKITLDSLIIIVSLTVCFLIPEKIDNPYWGLFIGSIMAGAIILCLMDLAGMRRRMKHKEPIKQPIRPFNIITEAVLLSEEGERGIRKWEMAAKTSLLIGKEQKDEQVDIDLSETEYAALVDEQHCILNFAAGVWYVEDLYSKNGIRVRKQEDGVCYKIASDRPCRLEKGDVLFVANTKLLFR